VVERGNRQVRSHTLRFWHWSGRENGGHTEDIIPGEEQTRHGPHSELRGSRHRKKPPGMEAEAYTATRMWNKKGTATRPEIEKDW